MPNAPQILVVNALSLAASHLTRRKKAFISFYHLRRRKILSTDVFHVEYSKNPSLDQSSSFLGCHFSNLTFAYVRKPRMNVFSTKLHSKTANSFLLFLVNATLIFVNLRIVKLCQALLRNVLSHFLQLSNAILSIIEYLILFFVIALSLILILNMIHFVLLLFPEETRPMIAP